jgi:acetyl esterase/lipase
VREGLREFALGHPSLTILYLESVNGPQFEAALRELFAHDPALTGPTVRLMSRVESTFDLAGAREVEAARLPLVRPVTAQHDQERPRDDPEVEEHAPPLRVFDVERDPLRPRDRRAAADLREAGDARPRVEPSPLLRRTWRLSTLKPLWKD